MKKTTKQKWLTVLLMLGALWGYSQTSCTISPCTGTVPTCEFVCNGGFNINNNPPSGLTMPGGFQQITKACGWMNGNSGTTPDYFHSAATSTNVDIPCNVRGIEAYNIDDGYAGLLGTAVSSWNEYITTTLSGTLNAGTVYEVTFYLSLADEGCNNAAMHFGYNFGSGTTYVNTSSITTTGWTKIISTYTAQGTEYYLNIGFITNPYFSDYLNNGNTNTFNCLGPISPTQDIYYFLDNVSIREILPLNATASSTTGCTGESFTLTASGADTYTWQPGNLTGSSVVVTPTTSTTYTVSGTSSGGCVVTPTTITLYPAACCTNTNAGAFHLRNVTLMAYGTPTTTAIPWSTLTTGNYYTGNIAIPSGGVITNTFTVIGGLNINTPVTFSLCNISINEDVPITQNQPTFINRSWLWGCSKLWEGIVSKNTLTVTNSFIEDAFKGINTGLWYFQTSHPGLTVDNTVFLKNWAGIAAGTNSMNPDNFKITGCVFMSRNVSAALHNFAVGTQYNSTLLPLYGKTPARMLASTTHSIPANTYRSNIGIYLASLVTNTTNPMFTVGGVGGDQATTDKLSNMFDYMNAGVYNVNSKINVYNCKFSNMINTGYGNAIAAVYHDDGTNNLKNTITVLGGVGSPYYKNVFGYSSSTSILDAVLAVNGGQVDIKYNDFKNITRYGVSIQNWAAVTPTAEPVNVANNSYTNAAYAFYAYNNQGIVATFTANTITNSGTTYTNNSNVYIDDVGKSANSTFYINNNVLKTSLNGVYARNAQNVRVVDNTIEVAKPTSTSIFNGAVWFDNVDNGFVKKNIISCNPSNANSWNTYGVFANASINNKYKCNTITKVSSCMKFQSSCKPTYNYNNSLNNTGGADPCYYGIWLDNNGQTGDVGYKNGTTWEAADIFWGDFSIADTKAQASSNYTYQATIYYNAALTPTADYRPLVNINTYTLFPTPDYSQSYLASSASPLTQNTCDEQARFTGQTGIVKGGVSTNNADDGSNEPVLRKQLLLPVVQSNSNNNTASKVIKGANESSFYAIDSLIALYVATKNIATLNSAKNINASILATNNQEQNQKDLNDIYCVFVEDDSLVTATQINYLHNLALMCPFTEGLSVYEARGLMRNWDDSTFYVNLRPSTC